MVIVESMDLTVAVVIKDIIEIIDIMENTESVNRKDIAVNGKLSEHINSRELMGSGHYIYHGKAATRYIYCT
jgi:ABC-type transporter Mla maintaining outer membrane lipid asymmetry ATPase subunit MlaF